MIPSQTPSPSSVPVIGSDLFPTVLSIVGSELPKDRVIAGVDMRPALAGKPVERPVPLYWRNHLAPADNHVALRIGDWKIVGDNALQKFQLYEIEKDKELYIESSLLRNIVLA